MELTKVVNFGTYYTLVYISKATGELIHCKNKNNAKLDS